MSEYSGNQYARRQDACPEEEIRLMGLIAGGDRDAFALILDRYMPSVFRFSYGLLKDHALAEDVTQESYLRLWRGAANWNPTGRVQSWLFRIAHNLCIDEIRTRRPQVDIDGAEGLLPAALPSQEGRIDARQNTHWIMTALQTLPERQRAALMLVYYNDLSNIEAAEIMEISVDALESLLARGRRNLKDVLKGTQDRVREGTGIK